MKKGIREISQFMNDCYIRFKYSVSDGEMGWYGFKLGCLFFFFIIIGFILDYKGCLWGS